MNKSQLFLDQLPKQLKEKVEHVCKTTPEALPIFQLVYECGQERDETKRKTFRIEQINVVDEENVIFELNDITFLSPVRKKLNFVISLGTDRKPILMFSKDKTPEFLLRNLSTSVKYATFLPFPEKNNLMYLFIYYSDCDGAIADPILLTMNKEIILKQFKEKGLVVQDSTDFSKCIEYMRKQAILTGFRIADPFSNNQSPSAFHVECHRGTKEGTLYFLPDHIIFGFKKPVLVFESNEIESITYSSITRLTFNVTLITKKQEKYEFSMIDQLEYSNIDDYVKRNKVKDKSMSDELKAKPMTKAQQIGEQSALKEAAQQMKEQATISDVPLNSDDEEADGNFESDEDSSNVSDSDSGDDADDAEESDADSMDLEREEPLNVPKPDSHTQRDSHTNGVVPQDIQMIFEDDNEDEEDEDSGVEYD
ncbi:Rtt106p Ecym_6448 [Eremothecium cymbalariae DBVPG|uniref:Histone chaperone RTT106 n=1 Tax=Eremothecium cymbalariae (strain CBS 270.75 / DBVPG 7215 / KCTC 17166 / NRRL Y-17582) TaxID=931890 RepID=G8JUN9_ERECY|nr:hypothetical protein Ecym_6448 [Eremothecium cymbalariae DBVPG\